MMKYVMIVVAFAMLTVQAQAADNDKTSTYQVVKSERSFFSSLWGKLKRIVPRRSSSASASTTAVLGVRGAETTESALKPHWEGDLSSDSAFRNDIKQFEDGTSLCESAEPSKGAETFEQLLKTSANAMLKANTMIALASCYAQLGDEAKGIEHLQSFLLKYPKHPMHDEINAWVSSNK
ncbi:MAG: hypothetical protein R8M45_01765 [Ghiorsea sp.]